jgi:hypothetical protein
VLEQAAGLALLAAVSPTALLVVTAYLGSQRPRLTVLWYLAGAAGAGTGMMARLIASPAPGTALLAGVVVAPSVTFVAAIQVIATAKAGALITSLGVALIVVIAVAFVWLPFVAFLVFPGPTSRWLATFNGWLKAHGRVLALGALAAAGIYLVINGVAGLAG